MRCCFLKLLSNRWKQQRQTSFEWKPTMNINLSIFDEFPNLESLSLCHSAGFLSRLISSKIACTKNNMV